MTEIAIPSPPGLALSDEERGAVLAELHPERLVDASPAQVYATLLDEGTYLASERTMYRRLTANAGVRERRNQLRHPAYAKPELLATGPAPRALVWVSTKGAERSPRKVQRRSASAEHSSALPG